MLTFDELVAGADRAAQAKLGGVPVTYAPLVGSPVTVVGLFDDSYLLAKGAALAGVESLGPSVFFRLSDLPRDPELDDPTLTIRSLAYRVIERRPDGMGGIVLELKLRT